MKKQVANSSRNYFPFTFIFLQQLATAAATPLKINATNTSNASNHTTQEMSAKKFLSIFVPVVFLVTTTLPFLLAYYWKEPSEANQAKQDRPKSKPKPAPSKSDPVLKQTSV